MQTQHKAHEDTKGDSLNFITPAVWTNFLLYHPSFTFSTEAEGKIKCLTPSWKSTVLLKFTNSWDFKPFLHSYHSL